MVERSGDTIIFNESEQSEFNVDPVVSVDSAIETADTFLYAAGKISQGADNLLGSGRRDTQLIAEIRFARAARLATVATSIRKLCASEIANEFLGELNKQDTPD